MVQSLTLPEAYITIEVLLTVVIHSSVMDPYAYAYGSIRRNMFFYGPGLRFVSVLHENGTVSDRYESKGEFTCPWGDVRAGASSLRFPLMVVIFVYIIPPQNVLVSSTKTHKMCLKSGA